MRKKNKRLINRKIILMLIVLSIFFILFAKLIYVQIFLHSKVNNVVEKMVKRENIEIPKRGNILDSHGRVLATSIKKYVVFIDPKMVRDFNRIKSVLSKNKIEIKEKSLEDFRNTSYVPIIFNVDANVVNKIKNEKLSGIGFKSKYIRQYPEGRFLTHVLGIVDYDGNGLEGIEKICNKFLSGDPIVTKMKRDGLGHVIQDKFVDKSKMCGQDVILSIDRTIQFIAEQELRKVFEKYKARKAICIVQNPKTGDILAMVSLPDFDPSYKIKNIETLKNLAISDSYEPGSTFKIITVASALDKGTLKFFDVFYLKDWKIKIAGHVIRDDHKIIGYISLSEAIEKSSNIVMLKIAQKLGSKDFYKYIRKFGFRSLTGIDLPGEAKGILKDTKEWDVLSLPTISFGQAIGVTGLQIINAFSAIANDGILMKPSLIQEIGKSGIKNINSFEPKEIRRVISIETAQLIKQLLKNAVELGTGKNAKIAGYTVGGKTGTSQKFDSVTKTYSTKYHVASFCGMLPAMNPKIVILVMVDEPKGNSYYASSVAAPVFANIARRTAEHLGIEKDVL